MKKINKTQVERTIETREPFPSSNSSESKEILVAKTQQFVPPPPWCQNCKLGVVCLCQNQVDGK